MCVTRLLTFMFFHDSNPSGPLTYRLKYFCILFYFAEILEMPRCASHRGANLRGVLRTAESNSTPRSQNRKFRLSLAAFKIINKSIKSFKCLLTRPIILTPQCNAHRGVGILELYDRISRQIEIELNIFKPVYQASKWVRIMIKRRPKIV